MIESIQIKNFRGIREGQIEGVRKFNLLVGPNNSGKSAVMEAVYLASAMGKSQVADVGANRINVQTEEKDFLGRRPMERVRLRHSYLSRQFGRLILNHSMQELRGSATIFVKQSGTKALPSTIQITGGIQEGDEIHIGAFCVDIDSEEGNRIKFAKSLFGENSNVTTGDRVIFCWNPDLTYQQIGTAVWFLKGKIAAAQQTLFFDLSNTLDHLPTEFFRRMIVTIPGWTQKIAEHFKRVFGIQKSFNVQFLPADQEQEWMQGWIAPADQIALTIDSYGDGARSAFKVLTPLLALRELVTEDAPGLFLWEEPELFQNPQTLTRLLAEVADLLKDKPIQVFIATHSLEVVANFVRLIREGHIAPNEMAAIRLNLNEGNLASSIFDHEEIQQWTEMDLDLRVPSGKVDSPLVYQFRETADATQSADLN